MAIETPFWKMLAPSKQQEKNRHPPLLPCIWDFRPPNPEILLRRINQTHTYMKADKLSGVPETMLITLWAKAVETARPDAILRDPKAVEIMNRIDYDFTKFKGGTMSQVGCCVRAELIDSEAQDYLRVHPDAVVIQLGAGIDARYDRLGRPPVTHWYDLDLPEAIDLRRRLLPETDRNTYLDMSLLDYRWIDAVRSHGRPVLIILEGVLMYFTPEEVRDFFDTLCSRLPQGATILFDMLAYSLVGNAKHHDVVQKADKTVEFKWSVLDTHEMEAWNARIHLVREYFMSDYSHGRFPFLFRTLYRIPYFHRRFNQRIVRLEIR